MIDILIEELRDAYDYIVVPTAMLDTPVELAKLQKDDESYYSINELTQVLGDQFVVTAAIDDRFSKFRWMIPRNGEEALIVQYLKSKGLVDMRNNGIDDGLNYRVDEIDFSSLNGNEFGIFSMYEIKQVPKPQPLEEMI